jgi:tRNA (cmo5U34)-methyltransferase
MSSWTFDTPEIASTFDSHVREQLPWYDMVTDAVVYIVRNYLTEGGNVVDVGASTGNMIEKLMPLLRERDAEVLALEKSPTMVKVLMNRFGNHDNVSIIEDDIRTTQYPAQVCIVFLTMMFIPVHDRQWVIDRLRANLREGGVLIVVDKVCDHGGYFATVLKRLTMQFKLQQGAKPEDVLIKEMSLAGVQIPLDPAILGEDAKLFFRMGEFAGWVIEG